jgi:hypothetical protein
MEVETYHHVSLYKLFFPPCKAQFFVLGPKEIKITTRTVSRIQTLSLRHYQNSALGGVLNDQRLRLCKFPERVHRYRTESTQRSFKI